MPNNILYARGFSLTIGKRSGKRRNRSCTDKNAQSLPKPNETGHFLVRQPTDELYFRHLLQALSCVKIARAGAAEIVDKFSAAGRSKALRRRLEGLWTALRASMVRHQPRVREPVAGASRGAKAERPEHVRPLRRLKFLPSITSSRWSSHRYRTSGRCHCAPS